MKVVLIDPMPDEGFLQRFQEGERSALESVYRSHVDSVARAVAGALRRYGSEGCHSGWREIAADVPDLVQEVFTRAFKPKARRSFDGAREYGAYLRQIGRNVVVDHLRRRRRQMTRDARELLDNDSAEEWPCEDPADLTTMAVVGQYLASLSPEIRRVHEAMYVQGLSQREAAAALGIGRQVVRTLEARLRDGLRSALETSEHRDAGLEDRRGPVRDGDLGRQRGSVPR